MISFYIMNEYKLTIDNKIIFDFYKNNPNINFESVNLLFINLFQELFNNETNNNIYNSHILSTISELKQDINLMNNNVKQINNEYTNVFQDLFSKFKETIQNDTISSHNDKNEIIQNLFYQFDSRSSGLLTPIYDKLSFTEERINNRILSIQNNTQSVELMNNLNEFLGKYKNSSLKGQFGENYLQKVLNEMYPSADILNTTGIKESCDFKLDRLNNNSIILFETKEYDRNVSIDEVKKFIRDIDIQKQHGVFLSQKSGITSKQNFQIDIRGSIICVYIHNVNYSKEIIKIAIDIIDSLSNKLNELNVGLLENVITNDELKDINLEYSNFITQKLAIINQVKDFSKKMQSSLELINMPSLSKLLSNRFGSQINDNNTKIICDICNVYEASSNKALASHKRACKKKNNT